MGTILHDTMGQPVAGSDIDGDTSDQERAEADYQELLSHMEKGTALARYTREQISNIVTRSGRDTGLSTRDVISPLSKSKS